MSSLATELARRARILLEDLPAAGLAYLLARELPSSPMVIVAASEERAERLVGDLQALGVRDVALLPGEPHVPFEDVSPDTAVTFRRQALRWRLAQGERPRVLVTTAAAVQGQWSSTAELRAAAQTYAEGEVVDRDALTRQLVTCGFQRVNLVEDEGTFAVRGGIVDVWPAASSRPVRLDLFGDELSSLKSFEADTQRTHESLASLTLYPIREVVFDEASVARATARLRALGEAHDLPSRRVRATLEDVEQRNYFYGVEALWPVFAVGREEVLESVLAGEPLLVLDGADELEEQLHERWARAEKERARALERHRLVVEVEEHLTPPGTVWAQLSAKARVSTVRLATEREHVLPHDLVGYDTLGRELALHKDLSPLVSELERRAEEGYELFLVCQSRGHAERLRELLRARKLDLPVREGVGPLGERPRSPRRAICVGGLGSGLCDRRHHVALLSDVELLGAEPSRPKTARRRKAQVEGLSTLKDLAEGDLVVHRDHGVGRYLGLKRLVVTGVDGDYVHLEYDGGDKLYLPVYRLSLLQRYRGGEGQKLDKLGGTRWERAKQRVKDAVLAMAHGLLAVQAKRKTLPGFALPPPDDQYRAFEASFPYEETPDQERAIAEVLADLQKSSPMDRLLVGDVGYGKTEVALRGAYLTALGGKQVAVLVPTTVLAEQHGQTFRERLAGQPLEVEVLSRFRSAKETRALLDRLREGQVDILVGTHRMLSEDVVFKELGLLVVDEEQRFGVKHKERIKQLKAQVHVLTMSATPIPRTMHMAMVGLRDLSLIQTPPAERTGIRTEVARFDEELIKEAILRELHRGGQVYLVHNRVHSIGTMASLVRRLVPEARVAVAHGQMSGEELERIMVDFVRKEHQVLVCTAIIESGIDIPAANTMIVTRADQFGLAQLYQLRGRIGRSRERAYAYLLLPHGETLTRDAAERLALLKRFSELGAGFQIASHDLDLRGAGDLLGAEQSGNIAAVGFELYTELLAEAVERAKGQVHREDIEPELKLPVTAVLPESYVPDPMLRLELYQRMAEAKSDDAIFDVLAEVEERCGEAPPEAHHLAEVMVIRRRLKALGATGLSAAIQDGQLKLGVSFGPTPALDGAALARRLTSEPASYRMLPSGKLAITVAFARGGSDQDFLRQVRLELGRLAG